MKRPELYNESNSATYHMEDDKLRLYVGRVPRDEYEALRAEGWTSTPKQSEAGQGEFAAVWTPDREDTALSYAGTILDEDAGPAERAADRAERFAGYRDGNLTRAFGSADRYDSGPDAHGYQSKARAVRAADLHDRHAGRAVNAWDKAEYWTSRTAGVIGHALYLSGPSVRMGRIKTLEAELRAAEKSQDEYAASYARNADVCANPEKWLAYITKRFDTTPEKATRHLCEELAGGGTHRNPANLDAPRAYYFEHMRSGTPPTLADYTARYLATHHEPGSEGWEQTSISRSIRHLRNRLIYENQMLEAQGGRAASVEMVAGGWWKGHQIQKVNKSPATGRVTSVQVLVATRGLDRWGNEDPKAPAFRLGQFDTERAAPGSYRAPTPEELAEFAAARKTAKAKAKETAPPTVPLINPTREDAQRLQDAWNAAALADHCRRHLKAYSRDYAAEFKPSTVWPMEQAEYAARSKGSYARVGTTEICGGGEKPIRNNMYSSSKSEHNARIGPVVAKVREATGDGSDYGAKRVIILTDKPQKALPPAVWTPHTPAPANAATVNA